MCKKKKRSPLVNETSTENVPDGCQTRSCHANETFNVKEETLRERTERSVVNCDDSSHEQTMLNEVKVDFSIPRLPHSVVKHAQGTSGRELMQKIENHPDRHALQQVLRQIQAHEPLNSKSKKKIMEVRNIELLDMGPKKAVLSVPITLEYRHCPLHVRAYLKETEANQNFVNYTMDFHSLPEHTRKIGRLHGHRYWKKPGDEKNILLTNRRKNA